MRTTTPIPTARTLAGTLATALCLALPASAAADGAARAAPDGWRIDVRVVRVTAPAATVEQAPALPGTQPDGTTVAPWADLLAALKTRGATQVVVDRSGNAVTGHTLSVAQSQVELVMTTVRSDKNNTAVEARPLNTGADVTLIVAGGDDGAPPRLDYEAKVHWARASAQRISPIVSQAAWKGAHPIAGDATLVLRHAEQDGASGGTEIYVLIGLRRMPR